MKAQDQLLGRQSSERSLQASDPLSQNYLIVEQLEGTVNFPGGIRKLHKGRQELRPYVESFHMQRP